MLPHCPALLTFLQCYSLLLLYFGQINDDDDDDDDDTSAISRLRSSTPRQTSRTKKFESFVNFTLNKYQSPL